MKYTQSFYIQDEEEDRNNFWSGFSIKLSFNEYFIMIFVTFLMLPFIIRLFSKLRLGKSQK